MARAKSLLRLWRRQAELSAALATTGMMAGVVIAARLPILAAQAVAPTVKGKREVVRMVGEKVAAGAAGLAAAGLSAARGGVPRSPVAAATKALSVATAATRAGRTRVRKNARRLTKP